MGRYWAHKAAQLTVLILICLAPVLLALWLGTGKARWARWLVVRNSATILSIINNESRYI